MVSSWLTWPSTIVDLPSRNHVAAQWVAEPLRSNQRVRLDLQLHPEIQSLRIIATIASAVLKYPLSITYVSLKLHTLLF
jgi:hypothetical protein